MNERKIWLGDKLPSIYSASLHIKYLSPSPDTAERSSAVYNYSTALHKQYEKSFTLDHVVSFTTVLQTIKRVIEEYDKFIKSRRRSTPKSIRQKNREWRKYCNLNGKEMLPKEKKGRPPKKIKAILTMLQ